MLAGPVTLKCVVTPALPDTFTVAFPVMLPTTVSVAVMVDIRPPPAERFSVAVKVAVPLVSVASVGSAAAASELVKWTVPA